MRGSRVMGATFANFSGWKLRENCEKKTSWVKFFYFYDLREILLYHSFRWNSNFEIYLYFEWNIFDDFFLENLDT